MMMPPPAFDPNNPIPAAIATGSIDIVLTDIVSGLVSPVYGIAAPGDAGRLFIVDQAGQIVAIDLSDNSTSTILDLAKSLGKPVVAKKIGSLVTDAYRLAGLGAAKKKKKG